MAIRVSDNQFHLSNRFFSYIMEIGGNGALLHTYFGAPIDQEGVSTYRLDTGVWEPYEIIDDKAYSLGYMPQEYPTAMTPDFRCPALEAHMPSGVDTFRLVYRSHEIIDGKPGLPGLPAVYAEEGDTVQTLKILLADDYAGIEVSLFYTVFENFSAVCRHSEIKNAGNTAFQLKNAQSISLDFPVGAYEYAHLSGNWAREKHLVRESLTIGTHSFETRQGASSHVENPFLLFGSKGMTEQAGDVYGISLIYSGNFKFTIESVSETAPRIQAGINPFMFSWELAPGETFTTPEAVIAYSSAGISQVSKTFHRLYRTRLCRGEFRDKVRPILINSWESTYFTFDREKLLSIAKVAAEAGIELFVLDDGWFGKRNDGNCSLGDWVANEEKLGCSLKTLAEDMNKLGLQFGLWFEPEMVSPDSDLYRAHPDWAIAVPDKEPFLGRWQLMLDLTRPEVRDYVVKAVCDVIGSANIQYVKWDKNRYLSEPYSPSLPAHRQGEFAHRLILGVYDIMERITAAFPHVLFESCSGGGGRNDPGMLYYMPQTWISDNTDPVERQFIQYGASLVYPVSSWGAHVSASPNHQTGRTSSLELRGTVAMNGAFGYELDLTRLSEDSKALVARQVAQYKKNRQLVNTGDYYRLLSPYETEYSAWMYVSEDKKQALVYFAEVVIVPYPRPRLLKLAGLDENRRYTVNGEIFTGRTLMNYGIYVKNPTWPNTFILEIESAE